jgi:hypothetical protein
MFRNRLVYFPFLLLAVVFILDKVALIPSVAEAGKARSDEMEKYNQYVYTVIEQADPQRPTIGVLGTSRSAIVRYITPGEIGKAPLSSSQKERLRQNQFLNLTVFGSDMFWQYSTMYYLLEKENFADRFDYFIIELSPLMINKARPLNITRDYLSLMNMEPGFILHTLPFSTGSLRKELILRLAFASYSRHFSPFRALETVLRRVSGREKDPRQARMEQYYFRVLTLGNADVPEDYVDYPEREGVPEKIYEERFRDFARKAIPYYETDPDQLQSFFAMLDMLKRHDIPVLVWMPMPHPEIIDRYRSVFEPQLPAIKKSISERGALFYDFRAEYPDFPCKRFTDANHMSARCATLVVDRLLDRIERNRPIRIRVPDRQPLPEKKVR